MNRHLVQLFLVATLALASGDSLQAQITAMTDQTSTPIPGAGHSYIQLLDETVNPANGSVSLRLNVPTQPGRGLNIPFSFAYDSNGSHFLEAGAPGYAEWTSNTQFLASGGWSYSLPMLTLVGGSTEIGGRYYCPYATGYVFQDARATRYPLQLLEYANEPNCPTTSNVANTVTGPYQASGSYGGTQVNDADGTVYSFSLYNACSPAAGPGKAALPALIEDRNGNEVTFSGPTSCNGSFTMADTLGNTAGRVALASSGFGVTGNTISVSGLANPYVVTWGTATANFSVDSALELPSPNCSTGIPPDNETDPVITSIQLPDGSSYSLQYSDTVSGLLTKITYPSGAIVSYVWGLSGLSANSNTSSGTFPDSAGLGGICSYRYDSYALLHRYVSVNGTLALQQDFSYVTNWQSSRSTTWTTKTTTVTSHDLLANQTHVTTYTYTPITQATPPMTQYAFAMQIPQESQISYQVSGGPLLESVNETWNDLYTISNKQTTLYNPQSGASQTRQTNFTYYPRDQVQEQDDYDFGATTPLKKTVWTYQSFPSVPIYPTYPTIVDRPCKVVVEDGNGNPYAETDYLFDNQTAACGATVTPTVAAATTPSGTHDGTNYAPASSTARGNVTSVTRKCLQNCTGATTTYTYDETGQVMSMTDPCGNAGGCTTDMPGQTSHTTTYAYTDNPSGGNPAGNSNAYLTQITSPNTGVAHTQSYRYNYASGEVVQAVDQNNITTNYSYADPFDRLTLVDNAPGKLNWATGLSAESKTAYSYPSETEVDLAQDQVTTGDGALKSRTYYDGLGRTTKTIGRDGSIVEIAYNGMNKVCAVSNPTSNDPGPLSCAVGGNNSSAPTDGYTYFSYDPLGRKTLQTQPDGSKQQWQYSINVVDFIDEDQSQWQRTTDGLGRLTKVMENDPGNPQALLFETDYVYDPLDNLTMVNQKGASGDAPRVRMFQYDSLSRLTYGCNPETIPVSAACSTTGPWSDIYGYDANGNVTSRTDARPTVTKYTYDALNRLTGKSYTNDPANTPALSFGYDQEYTWQLTPNENNPVGHLNSIMATLGTTNLVTWTSGDYDQRGNLTGYVNCVGSNAQSCPGTGVGANYSYNLNEDLTGIAETAYNATYNGQQEDLTYGYDSAGRLNSIGTYVTVDLSGNSLTSTAFSGLTYYPGGAVRTANLGIDPQSQIPAIALSRTYDNRGRITAQTDTDSHQQPAYAYSVAYDANGNVTGANDNVAGTWTVTNDALHRLYQLTGTLNGAPYTIQEAIDHFGNREVETVTSGSNQTQPSPFLNFPAGNNKISGGNYDNAGNLLYDGTNSYLYDAENRICAVQQASTGGGLIGYVYAPNGPRLAKGTLSTFSCDLTQNGFAPAAYYVVGPQGGGNGRGEWGSQRTALQCLLGGQAVGVPSPAQPMPSRTGTLR